MAKYLIEHTCGHKHEEQLVGPHAQRYRRIDYLKGRPCHECYIRDLNARRAEELKAAEVQAADYEMPTLTGSDKQIAWATRIRAALLNRAANDPVEVYREILRGADDFEERLSRVTAALRARNVKFEGEQVARAAQQTMPAFYQAVASITTAGRWIDSRGTGAVNPEITEIAWKIAECIAGGHDSIEEMEEAQARAEAEARDLREMEAERKRAEEARREAATLRPENAGSKLVASVFIEDKKACVSYPERDETVYSIVRDLRFKWEHGRWERSAPTADVAAEAAYRLYKSGINVRVMDTALRERVVKADFEPDVTKRVRTTPDGQRFVVRWLRFRDGDHCGAVKAIPGARYRDGEFTVPAESHEEIAEFARSKGFRVCPGAQALIEAERRKLAEVLHVTVAPPPPVPLAEPINLDPSAPVEVPADLLDD